MYSCLATNLQLYYTYSISARGALYILDLVLGDAVVEEKWPSEVSHSFSKFPVVVICSMTSRVPVDFISHVNLHFGLHREEPQTAYTMSIIWASHKLVPSWQNGKLYPINHDVQRHTICGPLLRELSA